jgi:S-formylglutathione hydrolase FrmB
MDIKMFYGRMVSAVALFAALVVSTGLASSVETIAIQSEKMGREIPATVILPDAYQKGAARYPVLYLLHGAGDTHRKWIDKTDVELLADEYGVIIVCPDGGRTSWYFDSPIDPSYQYETHVAAECVAQIDRTYRTKAQRTCRALSGNSMGGHGSLFLAIRHPDVFSVAVPLSGGVDIRPFPDKWDIKDRIGDIAAYPENWETYTVINLAKELKDGDLAISIDCGAQDFFIGVNRALHEQLLEAGVKHGYTEMPGGHTWDYWNAAIKRQMHFIDQQFQR